MRRLGMFFVVWVALAVLVPASSHAISIPLTAVIDGAQANAGAGTGSLGTGTMTGTYDTVTTQLSWTVTWAGLSGPATFAHFHGPALVNQNAGVQVGISNVSPAIGNSALAPAQAADLQNGLWYLNIHTAAFPGGEIRGQVQVVPEPGSLLLLGGALAALAALRRRSV